MIRALTEIQTGAAAVKYTEEEQAAMLQIKKWIRMLCRNKCIDSRNVHVSPYSYINSKGETVNKTLICLSDNLPEGPLVQISKGLTEVGIEDLLSCYKLINFCSRKNSDE